MSAVGGEHEDLDLTAATPDERDAPVRRVRRRWLAVGVAAIAVLAAGGGTYLAVAGPDRGDGEVAASPKCLPDGSPASGKCLLVGTAAPGPRWTGRATGVPKPAGPASPAPGTYRLTGPLPAHGPTTAASYRPTGAPDEAAVGRLAHALGLTGPVEKGEYGWRVGAQDGSGPGLTVGLDAAATWTYTLASSTSAEGTAPSPDQARTAAAPLLGTLGLADARVDVTRTAGPTRTVTADPVVDGLPTHGWDTGLSVGPDGTVTSAHGRLVALAKGEVHHVMSATRAFGQLSAPQLMHPGALACAAGGDAADSGTPRTLPCVTPNPLRVDITGAEFGLTLATGSPTPSLTPAWLFTAHPHTGGTPYVIPQPATT